MIMGPNRSNKPEPHTVIVKRAGTPVDLALIQNLNQLFDTRNVSNDRLEELQNIKQVLSIALHEHCSSHASFIYNRSFYSPAVEGQLGEWDLGLGKAMWRGFYSCLVFAKGKHQLLINLDGMYRYKIDNIHPQMYICMSIDISYYCSQPYGVSEKATVP
jgi:hypothetical protein